MARIRFYTDEQVARAVVGGLRRRGVDVLTVPEAGTLGVSDAEQLQRARHGERVIFTQDDDFLRSVPTLKVHTEFRSGAEISPKAQGCLRRNRTGTA